jgi:DnaJ-class molecular chaperone
MIKIIASTFLFICSMYMLQPLAAQTSSHQQKEAQALLEQAKTQMSAENYTAANRSFRQMLELNTVLPTEMCYFFANTLYMIGQYENSLRFLEKYQGLAGKGGEYFRESEELQGLLMKEMERIRACNHCDLRGYVVETCYVCQGKGDIVQRCHKCFGREKIKCETCSGEGVVIEKDHFGQKNYHSCTVCQGKGVQLCPVCEGKGSLSSDCRSCGGSGQLPTEQLCSHPDTPQ